MTFLVGGGRISRQDALAASRGYITSYFGDRLAPNTNSVWSGSGDVHAQLIYLYQGETVTNIINNVLVAGAAVSHAIGGIYSSALALLAQTADNAANIGLGVNIVPLTAPFIVPASGPYYAAFMTAWVTTAPQVVCRLPSAGGQDGPIGGNLRDWLAQSGQAALPNPLVPNFFTGPEPWLAVS